MLLYLDPPTRRHNIRPISNVLITTLGELAHMNLSEMLVNLALPQNQGTYDQPRSCFEEVNSVKVQLCKVDTVLMERALTKLIGKDLMMPCHPSKLILLHELYENRAHVLPYNQSSEV